jgi:hypothetical protein
MHGSRWQLVGAERLDDSRIQLRVAGEPPIEFCLVDEAMPYKLLENFEEPSRAHDLMDTLD